MSDVQTELMLDVWLEHLSDVWRVVKLEQMWDVWLEQTLEQLEKMSGVQMENASDAE